MIKLHVDDYGLSNSINKNILESIDEGYVNSVSVIVNNLKKQDADELIRRKVDIFLHICLTEGVSNYKNKDNIDLIYDKEFRFNKKISFYLFHINFLTKDFKKRLLNCIKEEIKSQINTFKKLFKGNEIKVDSHQHIHINKSIYRILLKNRIDEIRVPLDKYRINYKDILKIRVWINIAKVLIVNLKSKGLKNEIDKQKIRYIKNFYGILYSGITTDDIIKDNISNFLLNKNKGEDVMILLHPGYSYLSEKIPFLNKKQYKFYKSKYRLLELEACKNKDLKLIM